MDAFALCSWPLGEPHFGVPAGPIPILSHAPPYIAYCIIICMMNVLILWWQKPRIIPIVGPHKTGEYDPALGLNIVIWSECGMVHKCIREWTIVDWGMVLHADVQLLEVYRKHPELRWIPAGWTRLKKPSICGLTQTVFQSKWPKTINIGIFFQFEWQFYFNSKFPSL